jgi:regulator of replication initiation timing
MFSDKPPNLVQAQPNITQPYNTNHVAALEMIVKLAGENAVLEKENEKLRAALESAKDLFLQDKPQKAFIEICAVLGEKD